MKIMPNVQFNTVWHSIGTMLDFRWFRTRSDVMVDYGLECREDLEGIEGLEDGS